MVVTVRVNLTSPRPTSRTRIPALFALADVGDACDEDDEEVVELSVTGTKVPLVPLARVYWPFW